MSRDIELLLDGDYILYAAGFAGQKTEYVGSDGDGCFYGPHPNRTAVAEAMIGEGAKPAELEELGYPVYSRVIVDPPAHVFHSAKNMIETAVSETIKKFAGATVHLSVYVDGDGNFRSRYATIRPYKGNRSAASKPVMFNDLRQYLIDVWDATVVFDQESDDQMAIDATAMQEEGRRVVLCSVDKDMLQVPAVHYNPNKGWRRVNKEQGLLFLYRQCLTGDPVDNIQGVYKVGAKAAERILTPGMSEQEMWEAVVDTYQQSLEKYGSEPYNGLDNPEAIALENMRLVYLRRRVKGEIWEPPTHR